MRGGTKAQRKEKNGCHDTPEYAFTLYNSLIITNFIRCRVS